MDTNFNPYHEWLELDAQVIQPNYYELFGLDPSEQDSQTIAEAADRATAKVRSCRPGPHAAQWASLLDELKAAKSCLLDADQRSQYDAQLQQVGTASSVETDTVEPLADFSPQPSAVPATNDMYPPGMGGGGGMAQSPAQPAHTQPNPATQVPGGSYGADVTGNAPRQAPQAGQAGLGQPQPVQPQQYAPSGPMPAATPAPQTPAPQAPLAAAPYNLAAPATNPTMPTAYPTAPLQSPQNPAGQGPATGQPAYYQAAPAQPTAPAGATPNLYPVQPAPHGAPATTPDPMDPMAPVDVGDASTQPSTAQPQPTAPAPMTPAGPDPMAPVALASAANPTAADSVVPLGSQNPAAVAQPVGEAATQPADSNASHNSAVQVAGEQSNIAKASEHRNQTRRTLTTVAIGLGMFLLSAAVIYYIVSSALGDKNGNDGNTLVQADKSEANAKRGAGGTGKNGPKNDTTGDSSETSPAARSNPTPRSTPNPERGPEPDPGPTPIPTPTPTPMPEPPPNRPDPRPEPMPETTPAKPEPEPMPEPPPKPMPTADEIRTLSQAMIAAREALGNKNPEAAAAEIAKVESLTMTDEHRAMLDRLKRVTNLVQQFWDAVEKARTQLNGGDILKTPAGNEMIVVESSPGLLIIRRAGKNVRLPKRGEHTKLAELLADQVLSPDDPNNRFIKGAAFVVEKDPEWRPEGVAMWKAAAGFSDEGTQLLKFLDDSYDFAGQ